MRRFEPLLVLSVGVASVACGSEADDEASKPPSPFELAFVATANGDEVGCSDTIEGLGANEEHTAGLSDLRFYVSDLRFENASGKPLDFALDQNEFQYVGDAGFAVLIDLASNTEGTCAESAIANAEGTARTNRVVSGETVVEDVKSVSFAVGVPQQLMKQTIATNTPEGAPSPLNEMYWNWATGYRHFVFNFTVDSRDEGGEGYLHVGSRDCGPEDGMALEDRDECDFVNVPQVVLDDFDLDADRVQINLPALLRELDFVAPVYDTTTWEVIGEGPGVECHSSPMQADCESVFSSLGLDPESGEADASENSVFSKL